MSQSPLRTFLEIPYEQLEELNLKAKKDRLDRKDPAKIQEERLLRAGTISPDYELPVLPRTTHIGHAIKRDKRNLSHVLSKTAASIRTESGGANSLTT